LEGVGYFQLTTDKGFRCSTAQGFLTPNKGRENLDIITDALTHKVLIEDGKAMGVEYSINGVVHSAMISDPMSDGGEVILSAGAINSPQLLQLSGIGPSELLTQHGIQVLHPLPGVGENLMDHLQIRLIYKVTKP